MALKIHCICPTYTKAPTAHSDLHPLHIQAPFALPKALRFTKARLRKAEMWHKELCSVIFTNCAPATAKDNALSRLLASHSQGNADKEDCHKGKYEIQLVVEDLWKKTDREAANNSSVSPFHQLLPPSLGTAENSAQRIIPINSMYIF